MESPINPQPKRRSKLRIVVASGIGLLAILLCTCVVGATLITRSQSFQDTVKTAGAALTEMVDLQQKIATKYSFPQEQVGIRENVQVTGSGRSQTLQIILENTSLNALSDADREKEANKIANYARGEYRRIGSVDQICVITLVKQQVAVFSSSQARSYCYSSKP